MRRRRRSTAMVISGRFEGVLNTVDLASCVLGSQLTVQMVFRKGEESISTLALVALSRSKNRRNKNQYHSNRDEVNRQDAYLFQEMSFDTQGLKISRSIRGFKMRTNNFFGDTRL